MTPSVLKTLSGLQLFTVFSCRNCSKVALIPLLFIFSHVSAASASDILVSVHSNRSDAVQLAGQTVKGDIFVFFE